MAGDHDKLIAAAERIGYAMGDANSEYRDLVLELFLLALEPLCEDGEYDFAHSDMSARMSQLAEEVTDYRDFWQAPPTDAVYFHRKLGGMFLLASRLKARVNVHQLMQRFSLRSLPGRLPGWFFFAGFACCSAAARNSSKDCCRQSA